MKSAQFRLEARQALRGNWTAMAFLTAIALFVRTVGDSLLGQIFGTHSMSYSIIDTFLEYFVYFAFTYALYFAALQVIRKTKVDSNATLLVAFKKPYYSALVVINLVQELLQIAISFVILLPFSGTFGIQRIFSFSWNNLDGLESYLMQASEAQAVTTTVFMIAVASLVIAILQLLLTGFFQIWVQVKMEYPQYSLGATLTLTFFIMRKHWLNLLWLELSFIGWDFVGLLTLGIGFLWITPYNVVSVTYFYETVKSERVITMKKN
ncbi:hypothetical protein IV38_GL001430 [Lactobacillus selangorensis]|uniref:Integral membrane protein n=1 Tax=Lactobacillus selangorensis TaxID=81857 RepID=A0A0R2FW95_9LACO|nr:DUF975 family protein [Lactobacillus selangorensis]KRN28430.1 hypothetical protein IV38_GL001430 [Lactobacillus selangorensis]KRN31931.1 hypothetical protein IV40_GL001217 [Lactobacillus selangorensis]